MTGRGRLTAWMAGLGMTATVAAAQGLDEEALVGALVLRTPGATIDRMSRDPYGFFEEVSGLILGFGGPKGLDARGISHAVSVERARLRAREMRRLMEADLDDDLDVTWDELTVTLSAQSATMRGRLLPWFVAADRNADDIVNWEELRGYAGGIAQAGLSDRQAQLMFSLMALDLSGDGFLTVGEVRTVLKGFEPGL